MASYIRVVNFEKYQRFKTRWPPWVRLYNHILDDPDVEALSDACFRLFVAMILLASKHRNEIPNRPEWIKKRAGIKLRSRTIDALLDELRSTGFVEIVEDSEEKSTPIRAPYTEQNRREPNGSPQGEKKLTPQQLAVKVIQDAFESRQLPPPPGKVCAGWRGQWGMDDESLLRCLYEILDDGVPPHDPWTYVGKVLTTALKNGKKVWRKHGKADRRGSEGADELQRRLDDEDEPAIRL